MIALLKQLNELTKGNAMFFVSTIFNKADTSEDRLLSFEEWKEGLKKLKHELPDEALREIFDNIDKD